MSVTATYTFLMLENRWLEPQISTITRLGRHYVIRSRSYVFRFYSKAFFHLAPSIRILDAASDENIDRRELVVIRRPTNN